MLQLGILHGMLNDYSCIYVPRPPNLIRALSKGHMSSYISAFVVNASGL